MENSNFLTSLTSSIKERFIVSVYSNRNEPEKCSVGFIEALSNNQVVLKHITPHGLYDGFAVRKLDNIFRVDINGLYEKRLNLLYELQKQKHPDKFIKSSIKDANLFNEALVSAQKSRMVVNICIDETEIQDSIIGWVKSISESEVVISEISFEGIDDGETVCFIQDIVKINCDSDDERILGLLNLNQKK